MSELVVQRGGSIQNYDPAKSAVRIDALDSIRKRAQKIQDWEALAEAVLEQIAEQKDFVAWWNGTVGKRHGSPENADRNCLISKDMAEKETKIKQPQVSRWRKALSNEDKYRDVLFGASYKKAMGLKGATDQRGASGTGENEWYTPEEYLLMARQVMGEIDLDPASSDIAQQIVKASDYFTSQRNGLLREWKGRIWLNPPYAQPLISEFVHKMVSEFRAGRVSEAIMLTHNYTDTAWFHEAAPASSAVCFTRGRIKFYDSDGVIAAPTQGQAFLYFGNNRLKFREVFSEIGFVYLNESSVS